MQRTPIKLNIISISDRAKELIGYIVLDLRAAGKFLFLKIRAYFFYFRTKYKKWKMDEFVK